MLGSPHYTGSASVSNMTNPTGPEARLKLADSIYSVIYEVIDKGDESPSALMDARLLAEDIASDILDEVIVEISDSLDNDGNIVAIINPR